MTYPLIRSKLATTAIGLNGTSHTVALPAIVNPGDYLLVLFSVGNTANVNNRNLTWPVGWTVIASTTSSAECQSGAAYKVADGTEDSTNITVTSSNTGYSSYASFSIAGVVAAPSGTLYQANAASSIDPPSHTHTYGSADYLAFEIARVDNVDITAVSSGYISNGIELYFGQMSCATGYKEVSGATENPGTLTYTGTLDDVSLITVMIPGSSTNNILFRNNF